MGGGNSQRISIAQEKGRTAWVVGAGVGEWEDLDDDSCAHATAVCQSILRGVPLTKSKWRKVQGTSRNVWEIKNLSANLRFFVVTDGQDLYISLIRVKPSDSKVGEVAETAWKRAEPYIGS